MDTSRSRRDFIRLSRDAASLVALGSLRAFAGERETRFQANPFRFGVASGDPLPHGVVLWTRLDDDVMDRSGLSRLGVPVRWEIADDDRFQRIVRRGSQLALSELGHSVHAEVDGLRPGRHNWYRFMTGGEVSATGRGVKNDPVTWRPVIIDMP
jgi:alkaline phosphatase D